MHRLLFIFLAFGLAACGGGPARPAQTSPDLAVTFDGLTPVEDSVFTAAWANAEVDFRSYRKMILAPAEFEFRAIRKPTGDAPERTSMGERGFWISDETRQQLIETVSAVFREEFAKSEHWEIVETPGPDTVVIQGRLLDIVSRVPPDLVGSSEIYLDAVGEATIVLEVSDSLSGETIFRGVERSLIETPSREKTRSTTVTTWAEVRRWARRWAVLLVEGIDSVHAD